MWWSFVPLYRHSKQRLQHLVRGLSVTNPFKILCRNVVPVGGDLLLCMRPAKPIWTQRRVSVAPVASAICWSNPPMDASKGLMSSFAEVPRPRRRHAMRSLRRCSGQWEVVIDANRAITSTFNRFNEYQWVATTSLQIYCIYINIYNTVIVKSSWVPLIPCAVHKHCTFGKRS